MTIELIALDLDGTLLNNQHELSLRNAQALQAAREQGADDRPGDWQDTGLRPRT